MDPSSAIVALQSVVIGGAVPTVVDVVSTAPITVLCIVVVGRLLSLPSTFVGFRDTFMRTKLSVMSASVGGLDSLMTQGNRTTGILDPVGRYMLRNAFSFGVLVLALDVTAKIRPAAADNDNDGISPPAAICEKFAIEIVMQDIVVSLSLFVGTNSVTLFGVPIWLISHTKNA